MKNKRAIYFAGDFVSNNGPAIVNNSYLEYLNSYVFACKNNNKIFRVLHIFSKIIFTRVILVSGLSRFHLRLIEMGNNLRIPTYYLMHGYVKLESEMNQANDVGSKIETEREILNKVGTIICVSEKFSHFLKNELPDLSNKITHVNNGIVDKKINKHRDEGDNTKFKILSVGGGVKIKNILQICEAISLIPNDNIIFTVIGEKNKDGDLISSFHFVRYIERAPHEEVLKLMNNSDLYIQNSSFETFGLAVCEAVSEGTNILVSSNVGAISVLSGLTNKNLIEDPDDIKSIAEKIQNFITDIQDEYGLRFMSNSSWSVASRQLLVIMGH